MHRKAPASYLYGRNDLRFGAQRRNAGPQRSSPKTEAGKDVKFSEFIIDDDVKSSKSHPSMAAAEVVKLSTEYGAGITCHAFNKDGSSTSSV